MTRIMSRIQVLLVQALRPSHRCSDGIAATRFPQQLFSADQPGMAAWWLSSDPGPGPVRLRSNGHAVTSAGESRDGPVAGVPTAAPGRRRSPVPGPGIMRLKSL